ncbi:MAG: sugar transferase [Peptostreptococcaceae bacterium]
MENKQIIDNAKKHNEIYINNYNKKISFYNFIKRSIDMMISLIGIIILLPIFLITAILIKIESKGSIIFKQIRIGKNSKPFYIYKFRSMKTETPNMATNDMTDPNMYVTKIGKIIRKTSIDELPQLINILKGDMSIVGPRPVIEKEEDLVNLRAKENVDSILPGITGWAQINGRDNLDVEEKVKYDKEYLMRRSVGFDFYIMFMTGLKVIKRDDIR